jgi:hypothetical protein
MRGRRGWRVGKGPSVCSVANRVGGFAWSPDPVGRLRSKHANAPLERGGWNPKHLSLFVLGLIHLKHRIRFQHLELF